MKKMPPGEFKPAIAANLWVPSLSKTSVTFDSPWFELEPMASSRSRMEGRQRWPVFKMPIYRWGER
jgi:hypothetical protein